MPRTSRSRNHARLPFAGAAYLLVLAPKVAWAHSGPPPEIFLAFVPIGAYLVAAALWLKAQRQVPKFIAAAVSVALLLVLANAAFFLPGMLPFGNQNYGAASAAVNFALTLVVVLAAVRLLRSNSCSKTERNQST